MVKFILFKIYFVFCFFAPLLSSFHRSDLLLFFFSFFLLFIKTKRAQYLFNKICLKVIDLYLRVNGLKVINIIKIVLQLMYVVMNCERRAGGVGDNKNSTRVLVLHIQFKNKYFYSNFLNMYIHYS